MRRCPRVRERVVAFEEAGVEESDPRVWAVAAAGRETRAQPVEEEQKKWESERIRA